jgi:hypothetical protein
VHSFARPAPRASGSSSGQETRRAVGRRERPRARSTVRRSTVGFSWYSLAFLASDNKPHCLYICVWAHAVLLTYWRREARDARPRPGQRPPARRAGSRPAGRRARFHPLPTRFHPSTPARTAHATGATLVSAARRSRAASRASNSTDSSHAQSSKVIYQVSSQVGIELCQAL